MSKNPFETVNTPTHSSSWSSQNVSTPRAKVAGVGRAGFIRDPSGLLMSIIRTLAASEDDHQRELEKERLEEAFTENDEKLDVLVSENYEELAVTIKQFGKIGDRISQSRQRIRKVKESLQQCKSLLYCRQDEMRKLWVEGVEHKKVLFLLDQIERVKEAPQKIDFYLSKKHYLHATELLIQTLSALEKELVPVEALNDVRNELISKKLTIHDTFISELHRQIYVNSVNAGMDTKPDKQVAKMNAAKLERRNSGDEDRRIGKFDSKILELEAEDLNPDDDPLNLMTVLVESLSRLHRIPDMIEATKVKMDRHINMIVTHATVEVTDLAFDDENKDVDNPKRLLQLLNSLFEKFYCIVAAHKHVLRDLKTAITASELDTQLYDMEEIWAKIQSVLQNLLNDYLDADNAAVTSQLSGLSFTESVSLSSHFMKKRAPRPRVAKLFRFDASSHAISMNTYLREQRAQKRTHSVEGVTSPLMDHALSTQKVCKANPRNITLIFGPLKKFIGKIEDEQDYPDGKMCALHEYITDYVQDIFIRQIQYELKKDFDSAMKVTDPLKVLADLATQQSLGNFKSLLHSAVVADKCLWDLYDLTCSLDSYHDHFLTMACSLMQEYKEMSIQSYRGVTQPESEDQQIVSASWVRQSEVTEVLTAMDNWKAVYSGRSTQQQLKPAQIKAVDVNFIKEAQFLMDRMEGHALAKNSLIEDTTDLKAIASLHESLEWMTGRLGTFVTSIQKYAPPDTLSMLKKLAQNYKNMSEICLLCLHIEMRLHCFYHLVPMFLNNSYDIRGLDSMEHDFQITKLKKDISSAEENLNVSLNEKKYRYVFEGLGHQMAAILMWGAKHIKRISPSGVKKMCRNVFALQQLLTNLTMSREPHLDMARQFYEMMYLMPDDLQAQVVEQGVRYSEEDYVEALNLLHRSKPGSGNENAQHARVQRLKGIVQEQTFKMEHAEQQNQDDI
ncbi:exocyst complex component 4-like [Ciona intestinalis]